MAERVGGERIYVRVPRDYQELSDEERWAWARSVMDRLLGGTESASSA
jgi:hypothetical protein